MNVTSRALRTGYWRPGDDFRKIILESLSTFLEDGDIVAISEKALAVAQGRILDESQVRPGIVARILAVFWMRLIWGRLLGRLCHMREENIEHLRGYPETEGARHKQVSLTRVGLFQSLRPFSEGGIDTTNLPFSLASLPLESPRRIANDIRVAIAHGLGKNVAVVIVDSDKTYSRYGIHLSSRHTEISGITGLGVFAYTIGRILRWRARSTPLAWAGSAVSPEYALHVAGLANKARGHGAGRTVWDMAARFGVTTSQVSWEMLERVEHKPVVILKPRRNVLEPI